MWHTCRQNTCLLIRTHQAHSQWQQVKLSFNITYMNQYMYFRPDLFKHTFIFCFWKLICLWESLFAHLNPTVFCMSFRTSMSFHLISPAGDRKTWRASRALRSNFTYFLLALACSSKNRLSSFKLSCFNDSSSEIIKQAYLAQV